MTKNEALEIREMLVEYMAQIAVMASHGLLNPMAVIAKTNELNRVMMPLEEIINK